jgi:hypothetical protein
MPRINLFVLLLGVWLRRYRRKEFYHMIKIVRNIFISIVLNKFIAQCDHKSMSHALFMGINCQINCMLVVLCMYWSANALSLATATVTVDLLKEISLSGATVNR